MKIRLFLAAVAAAVTCTATVLQAQPQEAFLVLRYDFEEVEGDVVKDASFLHNDGKLVNGATVEEMNGFSVLHLGSDNAYLDMTPAAGKLLSTLGDFTVSVFYRYDGDPKYPGYGYFVWMFSTEEFCGPEKGKYFAYRVNEQRAETSVGGYNHESIIMKGEKGPADRWVHVLYTQNGKRGSLWIDGEKVGENREMPLMRDNFGEDVPGFNWLGRPAFRGDNYLHDTYIYGFSVYERAFDVEEIQEMASFTKALNSQE